MFIRRKIKRTGLTYTGSDRPYLTFDVDGVPTNYGPTTMGDTATLITSDGTQYVIDLQNQRLNSITFTDGTIVNYAADGSMTEGNYRIELDRSGSVDLVQRRRFSISMATSGPP